MASVASYTVDGHIVDVDEEDDGSGDCFYDVYLEGDCINLGDPYWARLAREHLSQYTPAANEAARLEYAAQCGAVSPRA